jgi:hypothetical protein
LLPPIRIKLPDRNQDMSLHHQSPIKIKVKEIKKNATSDYQVPIKIKICDRDKNMGQTYEKRQAKVREKDGRVIVKYKEDILETDEILEYLSNDYIKPIRIKLSTLDLVYTWLYELIFRFNFIAKIESHMAIVVMYGKFVIKLLFFDNIFEALVKNFGIIKSSFIFKHIIAEALDIFKVDGLKILLKFNHKSSGTVKILQKEIDYGSLKFKSPDVTKSAVYIIEKRTIGELTTGAIEDEFSNNKTIFDILYKYRVEQEDPDFYD